MKLLWKITKESSKILILASLISSIGGMTLEKVDVKLIALLPILILIPAMNDMIGDFGSIISSRLTTMLYMGTIKEKEWWKSHEIGNLFLVIAVVALISTIYICLLASAMALFGGFKVSAFFILKLLLVAIITTTLLIVFIFWLSATAGFYIFKKNEDPSNFLIPLTTSIADLGSMLIMSGMVLWFF